MGVPIEGEDMTQSRKQIAEQIDEHIYAIIDGLLEMNGVCRPETKQGIYAALCDLKRWSLVEWGGIHVQLELGPFCVQRENDAKKKKKS